MKYETKEAEWLENERKIIEELPPVENSKDKETKK